MNLNIRKTDTIIQKINYLFKSIKKNEDNNSTAEQILLKKYAIDLLDTLVEGEINMQSIELDLMTPPILSDEINDTGLIAIQNLKQSKEAENKTPIVIDFEEEISETVINEKLAAENPFLAEEKSFNPFLVTEEEAIETPEIETPIEIPDIELDTATEVEDFSVIEDLVSENADTPEVSQDTLSFLEDEEGATFIELPSKMSSDSMLDESLSDLLNKEKDTDGTPTEEIRSEGIQFIPNETPQIISDSEDINISDLLEDDEFIDDGLNLDDDDLNVRTEVLGSFKEALEQQPEEPFEVEPTMDLNDLLANDSKQEMSLADRFRQTSNSKGFKISDGQRYAFINELFAGDVNEYEHTLSELSSKENVIEAFSYINLNVKMKYKWKDDSPTTRTFHEIVKNFYFS